LGIDLPLFLMLQVGRVRVITRVVGAYEGDEVNSLGSPALAAKSMEGIVEAGPQLVLQLYIIARNGMDIGTDMRFGGKYDYLN